MRKRIFCTACVLFILNITLPILSGMESDSYRIPTSILSGGGNHIRSDSLQTEATLGQPSPLAAQDPLSEDYALYPGFWYAMKAINGGGPMPWMLLLLGEAKLESW